MGKCFLHGNGSGGGGLNFRVIGGTSAPSSPKENDIWVNTDTKINGWAFSVDEPDAGEISVDCTIGTTDSFLNDSGAETSYIQSNITDYTKLPEGTTKITISNCDVVSSTMCHAFYTADKTLISTVERKKGVTTYEVPSGAAYVRLTLFDNSPLSFDPLSFAATLGMESGFVWITTGVSSHVEFNALKKNELRTSPLNVRQYVNGAWVFKDAQYYQSGAWITPKTVLFDGSNGGDKTDVTGGWNICYRSSNNASITSAALVHKGDVNYTRANFQTKNKIDMTPYRTAVAYFTATTASYNSNVARAIGLNSVVLSGKDTTTSADINSEVFLTAKAYLGDNQSSNFTLSLDLSSVSGSYYFNVWFGSVAETCYKIELLC